jgi:hypothetical protein
VNESPAIEIALRIPGKWAHPGELVERLPEGYRCTGEALVFPDKTQVDFGAMAADDQFARIFRTSCRQPARADELATVDSYTVNVLLMGPGGSVEAARKMMHAGAAIVGPAARACSSTTVHLPMVGATGLT